MPTLRIYLICTTLWIICQPTYAQSPIAIRESDKRAVFRIETPDGRIGTGFTLLDSALGLILVTNKHMIQSKSTGKYFDSVYLRTNTLLNNGKVVTTGEKTILHLNFRGLPLFMAHPDPSIDIAIIQGAVTPDGQMKDIINPIFKSDFLYGMPTQSLASRNDFKRLNIRDGTEVQVVGFSFQAIQQPQFHISRFGQIALNSSENIAIPFTEERQGGKDTLSIRSTVLKRSEWLILDITSRGGDSGGPVFAFFFPASNQPWIIGIVVGGSELDELCMAYPSYYILDLIDSVKAMLKR